MPLKLKPRSDRSTHRGLLWIWLALLISAHAACADELVSACALLTTGQTPRAAAQFAQTLLSHPNSPEARMGWGIAQLRQGQISGALQSFEAVLATQPDFTIARLGRAAALLMSGRWSEAEAEYAAIAAAGGPSMAAAAAAEAWLRCLRGDYRGAQEAVRGLPRNRGSLAAYVLTASTFALGESPPLFTQQNTPTTSYVGLGSSLTSPGAAWLSQPSLVAASLPATETRPPEAPLIRPLTIVRPVEGSTVRGLTSLLVHGQLDTAAAYVVVSVGRRFVGVSRSLNFSEPLEATTWPAGPQPLQVDAYDSEGRLIGRGVTTVTVQTGDLTLAEPPASPAAAWVRRQLEQTLTPEVLPGVWEQLRGEIAWQQGRLAEAQAYLTAAFESDPSLPRVREELLAVSEALGLPVMQSSPRLVQVRTSRPLVALTFDDGPHPKVTPWVLDLLERAKAHATFFLVGKQVEMYPELARQILARGHEIGSHTYTHPQLTKLTALDVERELTTSRMVIAQATGAQVTLFRPPGGDYDGEVGRLVSLWGFTSVFWTCNICDYYKNPRAKVVDGMARKISPGGIILLHNGEDLTLDVLPELLQRLRTDGYEMCSVSELLAARSDNPEPRT